MYKEKRFYKVGIVIEDTAPDKIETAVTNNWVDMLEIRLDMFGADLGQLTLELMKRIYPHIPLLVTFRSANEGGQKVVSDADRIAAIEAALPFCDWVDIECFSTDINSKVIALAKAKHKPVVVSFHDFEATPDTATLRSIIDTAIGLGVCHIKLACTIQTQEDLSRLAGLFSEYTNIELSIVGMGLLGKASRLVFPLLGSELSFVAVDGDSAPGQWDAETYTKLLADMGIIC